MSTSVTTLHDANNFLALEPHLKEVLEQAVCGISPAVKVLTAAELADLDAGAAPTPALHLVYAGYSILDDSGSTLLLQHQWIVAAAVRHVGTVRTGEKARGSIGPLVALAIRSMLNADIPGARTRVQLKNPPAAKYQSGWQLIPSAFTVQTVFHKQAQI